MFVIRNIQWRTYMEYKSFMESGNQQMDLILLGQQAHSPVARKSVMAIHNAMERYGLNPSAASEQVDKERNNEVNPFRGRFQLPGSGPK